MKLSSSSAGAFTSFREDKASGGTSILDRRVRSSDTTIELSGAQSQVDKIVGSTVEQASDWKSLAAMTAGGFAYRWGKVSILSIDVGARCNVPLRGIAIAFGLSTEVTTFEFTNRFLNTFRATGQSPLQNQLSNQWSWSGPGGLKEGWFTSIITFGSLKGMGRLTQGENLLLQHGAQDVGMVGSHHLTHLAGWGDKPQGSLGEQLAHAETTLWQLKAGMGLVHGAFPGLAGVERSLDVAIGSRVGASLGAPLLGRAQQAAPLPITALAGMSRFFPQFLPAEKTEPQTADQWFAKDREGGGGKENPPSIRLSRTPLEEKAPEQPFHTEESPSTLAQPNLEKLAIYEETRQIGRGSSQLKPEDPGPGVRAGHLKEGSERFHHLSLGFADRQGQRLKEYRKLINSAIDGASEEDLSERLVKIYEKFEAEFPDHTFLSPGQMRRLTFEILKEEMSEEGLKPQQVESVWERMIEALKSQEPMDPEEDF